MQPRTYSSPLSQVADSVPRRAVESIVATKVADFMGSVDPKRYVGDKHHIVPKFVLKRFANGNDQVLIRDRNTGEARFSNIKDLAVKDFYTFIDKAGELDASFEQLWGVIETEASEVLRDHQESAFRPSRHIGLNERHCIDGLVALQFLRGPGPRRTAELLTDYGVKLLNQSVLTAAELEAFEFVPHQNEHLSMMARMVETVATHLQTRAVYLVTLDRPLLVTCDEPVCFTQAGAKPGWDLFRAPPQGPGFEHVDARDIIRFQSMRRIGLEGAQRIVLPIGPREAIVYDGVGTSRPSPRKRLAKGDADTFAEEVLTSCLEQAVRWVAAHPDHPTLRELDLPPASSQLSIFDGGSKLARQTTNSRRRHPARLDKNAKPEAEDVEDSSESRRKGEPNNRR